VETFLFPLKYIRDGSDQVRERQSRPAKKTQLGPIVQPNPPSEGQNDPQPPPSFVPQGGVEQN